MPIWAWRIEETRMRAIAEQEARSSSPPPRLGGGGRGEGAVPLTPTDDSDSWRGPLTRNEREGCAHSDLSPQAGRGEAAVRCNLPPLPGGREKARGMGRA